VKKVQIKKGTGTLWLPYYQSSITAVELPMDGSATVAFTDNLSGCAIYIGHDDKSKKYWFCHANSQKASSEKDLADKPPSFQHNDALKELDKLATDAAGKLGFKKIAGLSKARYNGEVAKKAKTAADFVGGTCVAGFFKDNHWTFWYQTFGSIGGAPTAVIKAEPFFTTADHKKFA
jgi:hypothetical protein